MLSDLLEIPALYRTGENIAYGSPLTIGSGQARRMTEDTTGAIGGALNLIGPAVSTAKLAVKGAKAAAPKVDAGRRSFGKSLLDPTQSTESLPAAVPTSIENIPMSRRTFLRAAASPVVQSTIGSLSPVLASQAPSVSSVVKQATAPVAASLSTPVKAGALNLLKQANDLNVRHPLDFRDRAAVVRELAQYEGQPLVGEGGLSLKEFMRQLKADPKVYETLMKDLDYLGASVRHSYASPSKEAYLSYEPMSAATTAREARIWDKYEGRFKEPKVRGGEDAPPRMFDPNLSEFYYDYGDVDPAILQQLNKAMEGLPHDEARKLYKKAATEYQKLEKADKSKFYKEAAKENSPSGKVLSTKDLYKEENTPASTMLSAFMLNDDKWFTLPTQDEFLNILRSKGLLPERADIDPEQLSNIYNNALGEAKSIVQSIPYDPRNEHIDKYYKGFGIDIPEYVPLSKRNPPPAEAEFAKGGEVKKDADQESDDPIGDFLYDYEMEQLRNKIAENEAALIDLTPVPTRVETGSDPMLLDVYPRLKREMEANPERYEYGTARLKDEEYKRPMLSEDASPAAWLEYKLRPRGQTDYSDKYPPGMELLEENNYYPRFGKRRPPKFKDKTPWDGYYAEGGAVEYDPDHIESLAQGLHMYESEEGLAPYGLRNAGDSVKGKGYYGLIPARGGRMSTEISAEDAEGEFPLLVPGLTSEEIESLTNEEYPESVYEKAVAHAQKRRSQNKSPFSGIDELRYPLPSKFASGGAVHMAEGGDAAATALDLYSQINRSGENIDAGGLKYWTDRAQNNQQSLEALQKEFMSAADAADDPYYEVNKMYQRINQTPDTEGFNYWVNRAQQEKLTPQQLGSQFIGGMPAITAAQERSGFGLGGQYGTYNGLPMLYAPEVDKAMQQEQRVTGDLVNKDNAIGWDPSSMSGELSRGAAAAGVYRAPLGMGMQGGSQFSGDLQGIAKQYGVDPEQYMQSAPGQYGQQTSSLDENALYNALNDKMKDYYAVQGYVPPAGTADSAFNRTDIGGDHARVMYQRFGDRLVPMEDTLQYADMQRAPKYSWTDYIAPAAIIAAPYALPYITPYLTAAGVGKSAVMGGIKNLIKGQNPITGAVEGAAGSFLPSPFAKGGAVNYNQSHIDELAERFHKEM
jgi:hypothetical protein